MGENNYIIGNLSLTSAPNGDVTLVFVTPMNINTLEFEGGIVHTYVRTYSNGQWGEWNELKSAELPESLQAFNSLYLNSNGLMKTQPVGVELLSTELKNLLSLVEGINELRNKLNQLENKANFLDTKIDKALSLLNNESESDTEQEHNNIDSFSLSSRLNTSLNKLIFTYNISFVGEESEYEIRCNLLQGAGYLTLDSIDSETKTITYSISENTPPSSIFEIKVEVFEKNGGETNDKPSVIYYLDGAFRYTEPQPTYNNNWTASLIVNNQSGDQLIQDTTFYADVNINKYSPTDVVNINSYLWSISEGSGIEILSGARNSRCYFTIKDTSTTQQSATIQCQLKDSNNTSNSTSKTVNFIYKTSDIASYFLKIHDSGTNVEDGYILDKHFILQYTPYHFNTQDSSYGINVWDIIKGPVMFDPGHGHDAFLLTDDAKGGDEIIIQIAPSKDKQNTDRISLHVVSGYNVSLEDFRISSGNLDDIVGDHILLEISTVPNMDNLKACTWELLGVPNNNYVTINLSGLISISSSVKSKLSFKARATSLIDPQKWSEISIGAMYGDTNENNNIETLQVYLGLIYSNLGEVEPGMKVAVDGKLRKYVSNGNVIPQIITDKDSGFTVLLTDVGWQYDETRITCELALELIGNLSNGATSDNEYRVIGYVKEVNPVTNDGKLTFSIAQYDNRMSYIKICYNYGGSYVDFHAQGVYMDQNLKDVNLNDSDLIWEFVDDAVSNAQLLAACLNNPSIYRIAERMLVPIDLVTNSTTTIYDSNGELYQINEVVWYDYDNFEAIPVRVPNNEISNLAVYLADPVNVGDHVIIPRNDLGGAEATTISFRDLVSQQITIPTKGLRSVNTSIPYFESDAVTNGMPYRVMLPPGNNYHNFILKCKYYDQNSQRYITKTEAFLFFPFESYPYPPELDRLQIISSDNNLTFDDSYPTQINLRNFFTYPYDVLDDGAPNLVFESNTNLSYSLNWNGILTFKNKVNGTNELTVYQPYRYEDPIDLVKYALKRKFNITVNRSPNPLETDFVINCASMYIGTTEGAPLDGVTIVSKDTSNNVLSGVTYLVVEGSKYCSVSPTGSELRVFDTGNAEKEVILKGTYGSKVSYATFKVKL